MRIYLTLTRRELASFFLSITGYVIISGFALLVGMDFVMLLNNVGTDAVSMPITQLFFNNLLLWIILILTPPIITMRLFALEKATGTFETLMTTPVGDAQIVLAKFLAALAFYLIAWLPLIACVLLVQRYANNSAPADPGAIA